MPKTHKCDQPGCTYTTNHKGNLKQHLADVHDVDVIWHACDQPGCQFRTKQKGHLKTHLADVHDIGVVTWHACDQPGCKYRAKRKDGLKTHLAFVHDVDVKWHACDQPGCKYRAKKKSSLKTHLAFVHDVGDYQCEYCLGNRNSSIKYRDDKLGRVVKICRKCFNAATGKTSRSELQISDYLDLCPDIHFGLIDSDKSFASMRDSDKSCAPASDRRRPDKLYQFFRLWKEDLELTLVVHLEVDEHQHIYNNGSYTCEERRISECYDQFKGQKVVYRVVRINPDKFDWKAAGYSKNPSKKERMQRLKDVILKMVSEPEPYESATGTPIKIQYLYYDTDNIHIAQRLPVQV